LVSTQVHSDFEEVRHAEESNKLNIHDDHLFLVKYLAIIKVCSQKQVLARS